jgi:hypothetical protein
MKILLVGAELFHAEGRKDGRTNGQADRRDGANGRFFASLQTRQTEHIPTNLLLYVNIQYPRKNTHVFLYYSICENLRYKHKC